jgi:hypothetical protein
MDSSGSSYGPLVGCYEHGNEVFGFTKGGEFRNEMSDYCLLDDDTALSLSLSLSLYIYIYIAL